MCPGIIKANYHLIIGGIIKRKACLLGGSCGSEAWEGREGLKASQPRESARGRAAPSSRSQWQNHGNGTRLSLFCLSVPSGCLCTAHVRSRVCRPCPLYRALVPSHGHPNGLGRSGHREQRLWQRGTPSSPTACCWPRDLLTSQVILNRPLSHLSLLVTFSRSRHSSEFMCANEGSRPICRYLLVFSNLPFYSREVQECGLEELNALSRALVWVSSRTWLQCPQDSWPRAPARPSGHAAVQHRLNKNLPLFPQCPVSSKGRCENTLGLVLRSSRRWSVPSWRSKRIALTKPQWNAEEISAWNDDFAAEMPKVKYVDQDVNFSKLISAFISSCP